MRAVASHLFVGGARLVRPDPENPAAPLPFEAHCAGTLDPAIVDLAKIDRTRIAEISRLAVLGQYRRRPGEAGTPFAIDDDFGIAPRIRLPYLTLGLYLALMALARWHGIETLFVLADPSLARSIGHLGIDMRPIGAAIELRGQRFPAMLEIDKTVAMMVPYIRPFFDTIQDEVDRAMRCAG
jgi:N-acyl amino acid synthase of PEP-CTERM/exosortase system